MILIWGTKGPSLRPRCIGAERSRTHMQFNSIQFNWGHKGPVLRPRCIGLGEGPYPIYYSILFYPVILVNQQTMFVKYVSV